MNRLLTLCLLCFGALAVGEQPSNFVAQTVQSPFEAHYHVVVSKLTGPAKEAKVKDLQSSVKEAARLSGMSAKQADANLAEALGALDHDTDADVYITDDPHRGFLYELTIEGKRSEIVLFSDRTYLFDFESPRLYVDPGFHVIGIRYWPYFLFNLPQFRALRATDEKTVARLKELKFLSTSDSAADVLHMGAAQGQGASDLPYDPGVITQDKSGAPLKLRLGLGFSIHYQGYTAVAGVSVPKAVMVQQYQVTQSPTPPGFRIASFPIKTVNFTLVSCNVETPKGDIFDPKTYLTKNLIVQDKNVAFGYDPQKGSIDEQADARLATSRNSGKDTQSPGTYVTAFILLLVVALLAIGVALLLRRRVQRRT